MDQLKDFLKQAVKYRFWIAAGISLLLPMIGYFLGSGPVKAKAKTQTDAIVAADKDVANYTSPGIPNAQYKPLVDDKTAVVTTDVNKAWTKLYSHQAPLLTWPNAADGTVAPFYKWGRKLPEDVDKGAIQKAITDYVQVYEPEVTKTYKKVNPWNPMEGTGVVVVPDEKTFLRPSVFKAEDAPKLGKIWAAQERLWVQGSLLDAVATINGSAKDWDSAIVKQIDMIDVGSPTAQDQKSLADGEAVEKAPAVDPEEEAAASGAGAAQEGYAGMPGGGAAGRGMMMGGMGMGSGAGASGGAVEDIYYVANPSTQFKIVPVLMQVLVDQNRLQEFFIGLENSPMAIQVIEFDMVKPTTPVTKPVKGENISAGYGGMMGMMGGMGKGMAGRMMGPEGYGGAGGYGAPGGMMGPSAGGYGGRGGMMGGMMEGGMYGGAGGGLDASKKGTDIRQKDARKEREEKEKARKALTRATADQYYDIVQVTVYGRARFYNPPPPAEPTTSEATTTTPAPAAPTIPDPGAPTAPSNPDPGAPAKTEAAKAETPAPDATKTEAPKAATPVPAAPATPDTPNTATPVPAAPDVPKAATPVPAAPATPDAPKAEAPKAEPPKAEAPKS